MITHISNQVKNALNAKFDFNVTLRIVWSMFWRSVLIGGVVGALFILILPRGEMQTAIDAVTMQKGLSFETQMQQIEMVMNQQGYFTGKYLYFLLKQYIPLVIATMIAAKFVFRKRYRRFALKPTADNGTAQELDWEEGMKIGLVTLLPAFILMVLQTIFSMVFGTVVVGSHLALCVSIGTGLFVMFFSMHLALNWHYRNFRIVVDRTQGSAA